MSIAAFRLRRRLPNCFLKRSSHDLSSCLKFLALTTSAISGATIYIQPAPAHFAAGTTFTQKIGSPKNLCKFTELSSTLSSNTSIECNLYSSWSNHLLAFFRQKRMLEVFLNIKTTRVIPTDAKAFLATPVSQEVNMKSMKRIFERRTES